MTQWVHNVSWTVLTILATLMFAGCVLDVKGTERTEGNGGDSETELFARVQRLPPWPTDRQFTRSEWGEYAVIALRIQELPNKEITKLLSNWGELISFPGPESFSRAVSWSEGQKLMILLRVVFEAPIQDTGLDNLPAGVAPFGGLPAHPPSPCSQGLSAPVWWSDGRPVLTGYRGAGGTTGPGGVFYFPIEEYSYFRTHWPYRSRKKLMSLIRSPENVDRESFLR
jgi:hypothetical protein